MIDAQNISYPSGGPSPYDVKSFDLRSHKMSVVDALGVALCQGKGLKQNTRGLPLEDQIPSSPEGRGEEAAVVLPDPNSGRGIVL